MQNIINCKILFFSTNSHHARNYFFSQFFLSAASYIPFSEILINSFFLFLLLCANLCSSSCSSCCRRCWSSSSHPKDAHESVAAAEASNESTSAAVIFLILSRRASLSVYLDMRLTRSSIYFSIILGISFVHGLSISLL